MMNPGHTHPLKGAEEEESQQREGAIREAGREPSWGIAVGAQEKRA